MGFWPFIERATDIGDIFVGFDSIMVFRDGERERERDRNDSERVPNCVRTAIKYKS